MKATIILAHPWHGSFNKSITDTVVLSYQQKNKEYQIIDLNKDNFDPVLRESELALYSKGGHKDVNVKKYQDMLKESDELVFIFPIWWYSLPAILKGFLDKVMLRNFAYSEEKYRLKGLLDNIKKTVVITTSQAPTWYLKFIVGNPIQRTFIGGTLKSVGLKNVKWLNNDYTTTGTDKSRKQFLEKVSKYI
ncbi:NAD(P)H-dependent oxidoreductase [Clostridium sp. CF012]|uniref:NAD(P)H-dependent oxidoreductase n=1 Tax=Clostridium sp. CF012 TaxID=2843319 RepID=UPI001C0E1558|nr:NAD(P)H-dependent oxidoreductase [Clostridium sp. CF012]MBU3144018.1 NAD(P)H-dependent oxidoreductase [Clostridium sp. CF012]